MWRWIGRAVMGLAALVLIVGAILPLSSPHAPPGWVVVALLAALLVLGVGFVVWVVRQYAMDNLYDHPLIGTFAGVVSHAIRPREERKRSSGSEPRRRRPRR